MPELPEVENTRRGVAAVAGARIESLRLGKPLRWPLGCDAARLAGLRIGAVTRRGKYLWMPLSAQPDGVARAPAGGLLWHLGMSGSLRLLAPAAPAGPHDHADLQTTHGLLRLTDPRRFGAVVWSAAIDAPPAATLLARLGPEPLDENFTEINFYQALHGHRMAVKTALLAGRIVVGVGNIYASEALHEARIDPRTPCARIGPVRAARLLAAIRQVLGQAIAAGGSTLRNYRNASGDAGAYQNQTRVYGRQGQPCPRCGAAIRRLVQAQRATYFCSTCQRR